MERPVVGPQPSVPSVFQRARDRAQTWTMDVEKEILVETEQMKATVLESLTKSFYNVHDFYHAQGVCQAIARNHWFEQVTLLVIVINAIYIGVDSDLNDAISVNEASAVFQVCENAFCAFFVTELLIRFGAFQKKDYCLKDFWFVFDLVLVIIMVTETWLLGYVFPWCGFSLDFQGLENSLLLRLVRIVRLTRMSRMARILQSVPELMILLKGLATSFPAAGWTATLLIIAMYMWALVLKQIAYGTDFEKDFPDILNGMFTLMITGCFKKGFDGKLREMKEKDNVLVFVVYFLFVLFSGIIIMKMLTGMLVKVINAVATHQKEQNHVVLVKNELLRVLVEMGYSDEKDIDAIKVAELEVSPDMFRQMVLNPRALKAFKMIGIDVAELPAFIDFIFPAGAGQDGCDATLELKKSGELVRSISTHSAISFASFMKQILKLKSSNTATFKDAVHLRKFIRAEVKGMEDSMIEMHKSLQADIQEMRRNLFQIIPGHGEQRAKKVEIAQPDEFHKESSAMVTMSAAQPEESPTMVWISGTAESVFHSMRSLSVADSGMQQMEQVAASGKVELCSNALQELSIEQVVDATDVDDTGAQAWLAVGTRTRATEEINYKEFMRVPKGTFGTVIARKPKLLIDWDCFTTLDYMKCMLDCAEASAYQVESIKVPLVLKPGMPVVVAAAFKDHPKIAHLEEGQEGLVGEIDDGGHAWVDFFSSGMHRVPTQNLAQLKSPSQRSRFLWFLAGGHSCSAYSHACQLITI